MMSETSARASRFARRFGSLFKNGLIGRRPAAVAPHGCAFAGAASLGGSANTGVGAGGAALTGCCDPDHGDAPPSENSPVLPGAATGSSRLAEGCAIA